MLGMKRLLLMVAGAACLLGADLNGKWNFVWQTPGGERQSTLTFRQNAENVDLLACQAERQFDAL
jgi:hypothetical protein